MLPRPSPQSFSSSLSTPPRGKRRRGGEGQTLGQGVTGALPSLLPSLLPRLLACLLLSGGELCKRAIRRGRKFFALTFYLFAVSRLSSLPLLTFLPLSLRLVSRLVPPPRLWSRLTDGGGRRDGRAVEVLPFSGGERGRGERRRLPASSFPPSPAEGEAACLIDGHLSRSD